MGFESEEATSLADALLKAERASSERSQPLDLTTALTFAKVEANKPTVAAAWRDLDTKVAKGDSLFPSSRLAELVLETSYEPEAVGHALVQACCGGHIRCVQQLVEIQSEHLHGSMLVSLFTAFGLLKAAEAGQAEVVEELLQTQLSASTALMGYMVATRWPDTRGTEAYPYVEQPSNVPSQEWIRKMVSTKSMLPVGSPNFQSGRWDIRGMPGLHENLHELVRASYRTYLLWRTSVVAASHCNAEVFRILLKRRSLDNAALSKSLEAMETHSVGKKGGSGLDHEAKRIVAERAKMDTLMYQLVEEYSTKNYHDAMLYTLWGHIQRGGQDHPAGPGAGNPRCVAQAQNGIWEMTLEVPLLMMPVEYALEDEEPFRRYKQLTLLYNQRAKVNIQLVATVEAQPNFLQVTVGVKHVRFKAENSRWDGICMGHFPTAVTLSVMPQTKEGTSATMTNSSSNISYKVGRGEHLAAGAGGSDGTTGAVGTALRLSAGVTVNTTVKNTPWRFEQLPLADDRGGSFVWTLQALKGIPFDRSNPHRMGEANSTWKWGRRAPGNPLTQLPFTSEGGISFTGTEFADTMMWRFPKTMEDKKLRWSIEGQIHSTFTTSRYFETRTASFSGDIEEILKPLQDDKKDKDKDEKEKGKDKSEKSEKKDKSEKSEKKDKSEKSEKDKSEKSEKKDKSEKSEEDKSEKSEKDKSEKSEKKDKSEKSEKDKSEKSEKKDKSEKEKSEKGDKSEKEDKEQGTKRTLVKLDTTTRNEFEEFLEFKRYREEQKKLAQPEKVSNGETKPEKASEPVVSGSVEPPEKASEPVVFGSVEPPEKASEPVVSGSVEPPESDDNVTSIAQAQPDLELQSGMEKKTLTMNLDMDDTQAPANRPSLSRTKGYNGRWLGSRGMEPLSPSPVPAEEWVGSSETGLLSPPRMPLGGFLEDEDLYKVPDHMPSQTLRSASAGSLDRGQRIKGLSVRSVRTTRLDVVGFR